MVATASSVAVSLANCGGLPPNPSQPMGLRELDGAVELLICADIEVVSLTLNVRPDRAVSEVVTPYAGPTFASLETGQVVSLASLAGYKGQVVSFEELGVSANSRMEFTLIDADLPARNQVSLFLFDDGLPRGESWLSPNGSLSRDPCAAESG